MGASYDVRITSPTDGRGERTNIEEDPPRVLFESLRRDPIRTCNSVHDRAPTAGPAVWRASVDFGILAADGTSTGGAADG